MGLMTLMRRFSIRLRMISAIGVVLGLLLMVGGAGIWGMQRLQHLNEEFSEHVFSETVALTQIHVALGQLRRFERDMIVNYEKPEQIKQAKAAGAQQVVDCRGASATALLAAVLGLLYRQELQSLADDVGGNLSLLDTALRSGEACARQRIHGWRKMAFRLMNVKSRLPLTCAITARPLNCLSHGANYTPRMRLPWLS